MSHIYLQNVTLTTFRKISDMTMTFTPGVNLILGHNGTGKSNILSLLTSATGVGRSTLTPKYDDYFKIDEIEHFSDYEVRNVYKDIDSDFQLTERLSFKDDKSEDGRIAHIVPRLGKTVGVDATLTDAVSRFNNFFKLNSSGSARIPLPTKFISVSRIMPRGEGELSVDPTRIGLAATEYRDWYNSVLVGSIDSTETEAYTVQKSSDLKKTEMKLIDTPASGVSVGQDSLSTIISALTELAAEAKKENYRGSILAIDEFDLSLHADAQNRLLDLLIALSKSLKIQVFISTHSLSAVKYFSSKKNRNPEVYSITYIMDRLQPQAIQDIDFFEIASSMYLNMNIVPPKIQLYTEDESGLRLFRLFLDAYASELPDFQDTNYKMTPMKVSKSVLKYLNGNSNSDASDEHFQRSLIIYDGDARFSAGSENEKRAASGEYILGEKSFDSIPKNTKVGQNAVILPSSFAPEAFLYFWLHKMVKNTNGLTLAFWRHVNAQHVNIERATYSAKFSFNAEEAEIHNLKDHFIDELFSFAEKTRLIEFLKNYDDSQDSEIRNFKTDTELFIQDLKKANSHIIGRASADSLSF